MASVIIIQTKRMPLKRDRTVETKKTIQERTVEARKGDGGKTKNNTEREANGCDITTTGIQAARDREDNTEFCNGRMSSGLTHERVYSLGAVVDMYQLREHRC